MLDHHQAPGVSVAKDRFVVIKQEHVAAGLAGSSVCRRLPLLSWVGETEVDIRGRQRDNYTPRRIGRHIDL